jgi:hypothetical protein
MYLTVEQSLEYLKDSGIKMNPPAFRKAIRLGQLKGVILENKKEGYQISKENLIMFMYIKKRDFRSIYKLEYDRGLKKGLSLSTSRKKD